MNRESAWVDTAAIIERIRELDGQATQQQEQQRALMDAQQRLIKLNEYQNRQLSAIGDRIASQEETYRIRVSSHRSLSNIGRTLDPTRDMPVWFEDALGNLSEIPMDWIHTWDVRSSLLPFGSIITDQRRNSFRRSTASLLTGSRSSEATAWSSCINTRWKRILPAKTLIAVFHGA